MTPVSRAANGAAAAVEKQRVTHKTSEKVGCEEFGLCSISRYR